MTINDTIYALASAYGKAGVAVFRLSGPKTGEALQLLTQKSLPKPRLATRITLYHPQTGDKVDDGLALWFPAPASYTGEDVVELHMHGGRAVTQAILQALGLIPGLRLAEPGEFTRRAFDHQKMDLTEVEGLADLIEAETDQQRRQALILKEGHFGKLCEGWREQLLTLYAYLEAAIDFADEDLPTDLITKTQATIPVLIQEIQAYLHQSNYGEKLRSGFLITLIGAPNTGKSTLLNALAQRDAAIVSDIAGTTRDVIECHLDLKGYPVTIADTAGLRETNNVIEQEGVRRSHQRAEQADLVLYLVAADQLADHLALPNFNSRTLLVLTKADLLAMEKKLPAVLDQQHPYIAISAVSGHGMDKLLDVLVQQFDHMAASAHAIPITRERYRLALQEVLQHLARSQENKPLDLIVEDIRLATRTFGHITGHIDVEMMLDKVFQDFCIGK